MDPSMNKKATDEYIERFMSVIDDEDQEQYKDIEVKVITGGEARSRCRLLCGWRRR